MCRIFKWLCVRGRRWGGRSVTGSVMFIPDPDFYPSRMPDSGSLIPDPKTATKERGEKMCGRIFYCSHKFHKIANYFIFEMLKKKIWPVFKEL
jgi:hypothetical protein